MSRVRQPPVVLLTALVVLLFLAAWSLWRGLWSAVVATAAVWMVVGFWANEVRVVPAPQAALAGYADGLSRMVHGHVVRVRRLPGKPVADQDEETGWWAERETAMEAPAPSPLSVDLEVDSVEEVTPDVSRMVPATGGVRVTVMDKVAKDGGPGSPESLNLGCGDEIQAPMRLKAPERYRDPGAWQYADYLLAQGVGFRASVRQGKLERLGSGAAKLQCRIFAAQSWASGRMTGFVESRANRGLPRWLRLDAGDGGMLNAMMFGDRTGLSHSLRLGFERTGSFHLFVVSGMHVGLLAGLFLALLRRLRVPQGWATALTIVMTTAYALLTGFGAPVQRALWMTTVFLLARVFSRERDSLNALGAAALGVLVWSPGALFESSFEMTFLAIVAIAGIAVPLGEWSFTKYGRVAEKIGDEWLDQRLPPRLAQMRVMLRVWGETLAFLLGRWAFRLPAALVRGAIIVLELALVGTIAELVMVLPMALYFHRATMFALPANMLSVPVVAMLAPVAVVTFAASLVSPWLAVVPGAVTGLLLHTITAIIGRVSHVQMADLRVPAPVLWVIALDLVCLGFCCWAARRSRGGAAAAAVALPLAAVLVLWPARPSTTPARLEVTAIDVGQGDSLLVVSPEGKTMLVDAGGPVGGLVSAAEATSHFDVGDEVVSTYLWSRRIRQLDVVALSHAHSDHMGGMAAVLRNFRPRELWLGTDANSEAFRSLLAEAAELGIALKHWRADDAVAWGGADVKVLSPGFEYENAGPPKNDDSLVLRVEYGKASVLLEGDAEAGSEAQMVAAGRVTPVTLLKVGHHGSRTSTTPEFFAAARPKEAVVSVGKGNTFGHPRGEVIARLADGGTKLFRTDEFGLTTFLLDRDGGIREVLGAGDQ